MTSLSEAPAPVPIAPQDAPKKKGGVDYSKFDSIVDSDDEKPAAKNSTASAQATPAEVPHCHNCMKEIVPPQKPLRCGVCKKVSYCSQECQRSDWSFHKRNCKKPEEPKPKASPQEKQAKKEARSEKKRNEAEEKVFDDGEEKLDWYRHREWKPTAEPKQEFRPTQMTGAAVEAAANQTASTGDGSVWNKAGTWEDKDVTSLAQSSLREKLQEAPLPSIDVAGGALAVQEVEKVDGDASKPVIRGKMRHIFDLSFTVKFVFKWMDSDGQKQASGSLSVSDFNNDAFSEDGANAPVFELSFKEGARQSLEAARRKAVEDAIGISSWPALAGTLVAALAARMLAWSREYQEM